MNSAQSFSKKEFRDWNEKMAQEFDPDTYHESSSGIVAWVERSRVRCILRLLNAQKSDRVLEVGVGAGNILAKIKSDHLAGIDLSPFLLEKARKRLGESALLIEGDAEELLQHVQPRSYDMIFCSEVLEHVQYPDRVLAEMAGALASGGTAVVSVPNEAVINTLKSILKSIGVFRILFPKMADHMEDAWHLRSFSPALLRRLCEQHFVIEKLCKVPFPFLPIRLVAKLSLRPLPASVESLLRCPQCKGALTSDSSRWSCAHCSITYMQHAGIPLMKESTVPFVAPPSESGGAFKNFFKQWPGLYSVLFVVVGPALLTGVTSRRFVKRLPATARVLQVGSGPRRISPSCINVDIMPFPGVDVVADIHSLPFADGTFDAVTCEQVLEHVSHPHEAAAELLRIVKPGGMVHVAMPFVFPWHPSPSDYTRWTQEGLADLFAGSTVTEQGIMAGPFSALNAFLPAFLATVLSFGIRPLQTVLQYLFLVICIPVKLPDLLFAHLPGAELCAADLYMIVKKQA